MNDLKDRTKKVRGWFEQCDTRDHLTRNSLLRAVQMIYTRQTSSEQMSSTTKVINNIGFNSADAGYFSWVAQTFQRSNIPNKVAIKCKFRMKKYSRQIAEIALDNERKCGRL